MANHPYLLQDGVIHGPAGRLDPWTWRFEPAARPAAGQALSALDAIAAIARGGATRRIPVGVIGPREASPAQLHDAEQVGLLLGRLGLTMICGGKGGVMEAAARGCHQAGGLTVGLLPDSDWRAANPFIALPVATGLSEARNMVIAKSCAVLVAVGGSYGTLSEIAYGLHFGKPVIGLSGAPAIDGLEPALSPEDAVTRLAGHLMRLAHAS